MGVDGFLAERFNLSLRAARLRKSELVTKCAIESYAFGNGKTFTPSSSAPRRRQVISSF